MAGKPSPTSVRAIAARLSIELGRAVTSKAVKVWRQKGYPLDDPVALEARIKNQERGPKKTGNQVDPVDPEESESADELEGDSEPSYFDIEKELRALQKKLLDAKFYEDARTIRIQIAGIRDILKSLREQGYYVTKESQLRDGLATGQAIKSLVLKIPAELPQMIIGLDYADAVAKCLADGEILE